MRYIRLCVSMCVWVWVRVTKRHSVWECVGVQDYKARSNTTYMHLQVVLEKANDDLPRLPLLDRGCYLTKKSPFPPSTHPPVSTVVCPPTALR